MTVNFAYLDAGVWIAYGLGKDDKFYKPSKNLIENRLGKNKLVGIVSLLSILESIDAIRRRVIERTSVEDLDSMPDDDFRSNHLQEVSDDKIRKLAVYLTEKERKMEIIFADFSRVDLNAVMNNVHAFIKDYFGVVRKYLKCGRCWQDYPNYAYKGLGYIDLAHVHLACSFRCNSFITTDQYFRHIEDDNRFSTLEFEIFRPS